MRKPIEIDHKLDMEYIKEAISYYLSLDKIYDKDMDTLKFDIDENEKTIGASVKIWL